MNRLRESILNRTLCNQREPIVVLTVVAIAIVIEIVIAHLSYAIGYGAIKHLAYSRQIVAAFIYNMVYLLLEMMLAFFIGYQVSKRVASKKIAYALQAGLLFWLYSLCMDIVTIMVRYDIATLIKALPYMYGTQFVFAVVIAVLAFVGARVALARERD